MLIISSLAMNAFVQSSTSFNKDKKNIDSSQNMSVILELIGNDIRQSGENISLNNFPTIEFKVADTSETTLKSGSSKIIVRRALAEPLTLCQTIAASTNLATLTSLVVADNTAATVTASANCNVGTATSQLFAARPSTEYALTATADTPPTPNLSTADFILPKALRKVRDYRCQLDNINPNVAYDDPSQATATFCENPASAPERTRVAVSNTEGKFLIFNQTNETVNSTNTATAKKYGITINTIGLDTVAVANNITNNAVAYGIGSPIYVIEERVYTLATDGSFQVAVNGQPAQTLIKKIENFRVSARIYTNSTDRTVNPNPTPVADVCGTVTAPLAAQPTTGTDSSPQYICKFNYYTTTTDKADWKTLAGIKVEIQAKYDGAGGSATPSTEDTNKLYSAAEFFPRNVLSR